MDEEKQIEQMARITCQMYTPQYDKRCAGVGECDYKCLHYQRCEVLYATGYHKQPEWISVEDRLPENGVHCLLCCTVKFSGGTRRRYICTGFHAEKYKNLAYGVDDDCVTDYNEEDDEYYISEGWYEVINNWDDYDFVAIDDFVTHWMPLPTPPAEKEN